MTEKHNWSRFFKRIENTMDLNSCFQDDTSFNRFYIENETIVDNTMFEMGMNPNDKNTIRLLAKAFSKKKKAYRDKIKDPSTIQEEVNNHFCCIVLLFSLYFLKTSLDLFLLCFIPSCKAEQKCHAAADEPYSL